MQLTASSAQSESVLQWTAAHSLSTGAAVLPPDPEDEYKVEWLADGTTTLLKRYELFRKRVPLTRAVIKSWLPLVAEAETITVWPLPSLPGLLPVSPPCIPPA